MIPGYSPRHMTYDLRRLRRKGLARSWHDFERALDDRIKQAAIAA